MNAVDCFLMTSNTEGSPQVIKEALACGCPIVSVDVGDVKQQIKGVDGCCIAERNSVTIAEIVKKALASKFRTTGKSVIIEKGLTNSLVSLRIKGVYKSLLA